MMDSTIYKERKIEMEKQEVKIEYNKGEVFFFKHSFKTALQHAEDYIERNRGKFDMKLFVLNQRNFGEKWILIRTIKSV
jgi:hypothetical protein